MTGAGRTLPFVLMRAIRVHLLYSCDTRMTIDVTQPERTLAYLLALPGELPGVEFKRVGESQKGVRTAVCAFANSDGGWLVLGLGDPAKARRGVEPSDRLHGVQENPEAFDQLRAELRTCFDPPILGIEIFDLPCTLRDGRPGHLSLIRVPPSDRVHSIVGGGTYTRGGASNRQLSAQETADLALRRGDRSAEQELVSVPLTLLDTNAWRSFVQARELRADSIAEQLRRVGLAAEIQTATGTEIRPTRAAVLLFAEEPGSLLAAHGTRADLRLMVYSGKEVSAGATPNLRKSPRTFRGPLIELINTSIRAVLDELAEGLTLEGSGFKTRHKYPERVVKEAIVNAVIHRDYGLNRDIIVRIFDNRIVVESPGVLPGRITPANIKIARSKSRNPLIAMNLREFPVAPNIDAGEGVRMMFSEMEVAALYPPNYREIEETAVPFVELTLLNEERPAAWAEVSDWIDRLGPISNSDVVRIAKVDTLRASRMLKGWVDAGLLTPLPDRGRRNAAYQKA